LIQIRSQTLADVIIPARNEEKTVGRILAAFMVHPGIRNVNLVIDPDTTDATYQRARNLIGEKSRNNVRIIHSNESGKGQCISQAMPFIRARKLILCDADLQEFTHRHVTQLLTGNVNEQLILVPRYPTNVLPVITESWPWVSGQRCVPASVARAVNFHGYLVEVQLNTAMGRIGIKTRFQFADDLISPFRMTPERLAEMEQDRLWGMRNGVFPV
jgi:glycosyltransferase involved in cell wall biosynthesis